jgi:hypothetical protein
MGGSLLLIIVLGLLLRERFKLSRVPQSEGIVFPCSYRKKQKRAPGKLPLKNL